MPVQVLCAVPLVTCLTIRAFIFIMHMELLFYDQGCDMGFNTASHACKFHITLLMYDIGHGVVTGYRTIVKDNIRFNSCLMFLINISNWGMSTTVNGSWYSVNMSVSNFFDRWRNRYDNRVKRVCERSAECRRIFFNINRIFFKICIAWPNSRAGFATALSFYLYMMHVELLCT